MISAKANARLEFELGNINQVASPTTANLCANPVLCVMVPPTISDKKNFNRRTFRISHNLTHLLQVFSFLSLWQNNNLKRIFFYPKPDKYGLHPAATPHSFNSGFDCTWRNTPVNIMEVVPARFLAHLRGFSSFWFLCLRSHRFSGMIPHFTNWNWQEKRNLCHYRNRWGSENWPGCLACTSSSDNDLLTYFM